ncbi:ATP-binding protein [Candidatus Saccharibacteria bacterium]|nr:ATP-binding protein [Candidatus Saccharibacteria bacterium]
MTEHDRRRTTRSMIRGTMAASIILTPLLTLKTDGSSLILVPAYICLGIALAYLLVADILVYAKKPAAANWMLITLYAVVTLLALLAWGFQSPLGLVAACFTIVIPGILFGARYILPVTFVTISALVLAYHFEIQIATNITPWDLLTYITSLCIFALVTWLSRWNIERALERARTAEARVRSQKSAVTEALTKESARLRAAQLQELQQLYKFAVVGQLSTATLHELSNHLSVLNMDIDDLRQSLKNSQAIQNAKESIRRINEMVRNVRQQLNSYDDTKSFTATMPIRNVIRDMRHKATARGVRLIHAHHPSGSNRRLIGDPLALTQIISILINNAIDACSSSESGAITITTRASGSNFTIVVSDNGPGIPAEVRSHIFSPVSSSKQGGLGVGLYIAKHLAETHFRGTVLLEESPRGASFRIEIPLVKPALPTPEDLVQPVLPLQSLQPQPSRSSR